MPREPHPAEVRRLVLDNFHQLGASPQTLLDMDEKILVDAGRCLARSYRTDRWMAMWLIEVGLVQFYGADGQMLHTVPVPEGLDTQRVAA